MMAYVRCNGTCENTSVKQEYKSAKGCAAAKLFYGGDGACTYGCLGFGDCAAVCPKEAIDLVNGVAKVDPDLCIGCAMCSKVCPNHIIDMIPRCLEGGRHLQLEGEGSCCHEGMQGQLHRLQEV